MTVKTLQLRKNLKKILDATFDEEVFLNYYGELFQIVPVSKSRSNSQTQRVIQKFINSPSIDTKDIDFLDEKNPSKEKENIKNLVTGRYV